MDEKHRKSERLFLDLLHNRKVGSIDGVTFDFRHPELSADEWKLTNRFEPDLLQRDQYQPFIWYPWFGTFDAKHLDELISMARSDEKLGSLFQSKKNQKTFITMRTPEHILSAGDQVYIERVEKIALSEAVDAVPLHLHDEELRVAVLAILKKSGKAENVEKGLIFYGATATYGYLFIKETTFFSKLRKRIYQHTQIDSLKDWRTQPFQPGSRVDQELYQVLSAVQFLTEYVSEEMDAIPELFKDEKKRMSDPAERELILINEAMKLGYFWARVEVDLKIKPAISMSNRVIEGAARGGQNSGKVRRAKAESTWKLHAKELATSIRNSSPNLSQEALATEIIFQWKNEDHLAPGHRWIKNLISEMEHTGELLPRRAKG